MTKNPYFNAALAFVYIVAIVLFLQFAQYIGHDMPDTIFIPMAMLSLLVLSAAVMGYIFFLSPVQMYLDGHKKEAISFFLKTLGTFAVITICALAAALISL